MRVSLQKFGLFFLAVVLAGAGCLNPTKTVSFTAKRGEMVYIPASADGLAGNEIMGYPLGYTFESLLNNRGTIGYSGQLLADLSTPIYDHQRGWTVVGLHVGSSAEPLAEMTTIAVSRVHLDPATQAAIVGHFDEAPQGITWPFTSQIVVIAQVPTHDLEGYPLPDGVYSFGARTVYGTTENTAQPCPVGVGDCWEEPNVEIGNVPSYATITVEGESTVTNPLDPMLVDNIADVYPFPKATLQFSAVGGKYPAAARIIIDYNTSKITEIKAAFEEQHGGRSSTVLFDSDTPGELRIDLLDPTESVRWLSFAFDVDPSVAVQTSQIVPGTDITVNSFVAYDADGYEISGSSVTLLPDIR